MAVTKTPAERPWPLAQRPGFLIRRLHQIHVALFTRNCAEFGITPLQYSLLGALARRGEADQTTLAEDVALDRTTTAGAIRRLETRGLVRRTVFADDRRARLCACTEPGLELLAAIEPSARAAHDETLAGLSAAEQKVLVALMRRLVAAAG
ncbi:MarR family transcriptional regulator [Humitalea rosea]|uniref:MarR family transcriptional regulator n=1 Tax=Humitalea rosea TaxID=990373 RepID=A0A2W7IFB0_9PROT|nr:MarR family transcriptional regulator [Humitalea rosea]